MAFPWDASGRWNNAARQRPLTEVLVVTVLTALAVAAPRLLRGAGRLRAPQVAVGGRWPRLRILAALPYVCLVAVLVTRGLWQTLHGGTLTVGSAVAFGLTGAVLLAQPRDAELTTSADRRQARRAWSSALMGLTGVVIAGCCLSVVLSLTDLSGTVDLGASGGGVLRIPSVIAVAAVAATVSMAVLVSVPLIAMVRPGARAARAVVVVLGVGVLVACGGGLLDSWALPRVEYLRLPLQQTWDALAPVVQAPDQGAAGRAGPGDQTSLLPLFNGAVPLGAWLGVGLLAVPVLAAMAVAPGLAPWESHRRSQLGRRQLVRGLLWLQVGVTVTIMMAAVVRIAAAASLQRIDGFWWQDRSIRYLYGTGVLDRVGLSSGPMIATMVLAGISALVGAYAATGVGQRAPGARTAALIAAAVSACIGLLTGLLAPELNGAALGSVIDRPVVSAVLTTVPAVSTVTIAHVLAALVLPTALVLALRGYPRCHGGHTMRLDGRVVLTD